LSNIKKDLTTTWDVTLKTSYPTFFVFTKEKMIISYMNECKKSRDVDCLLRASIEYNIDEDNKDATLNHSLYDDELESTIEEDIHNISIQQNEVKKEYNHENIKIKYILCHASTTSYVFEITKTLEFMKNEKKNSKHSKL